MPAVTGETAVTYCFGPFQLDAADRRLLRGHEPIPLRAKLFDTLLALIERRGKLIGKHELMAAVWPDSIVEETNLAHNVSVLRKILGGKDYIETVSGHGYRFLADVREGPAPAPGGTVEIPEVSIPREPEARQLLQAFDAAARGQRQVVFLTGPAGLGKTHLVDRFLDDGAPQAALSAIGQCLEQRRDGEPYLAVLDALGKLCRGRDGRRLIDTLIRYAPTWLIQMPWLLPDAELSAVRQTTYGATRERMLREIVEAFDVITAEKPVVLALEDLHWSDSSTLELIECLARRRAPARLLILATVRTADLPTSRHRVHRLLRDLTMRGMAREIELPPFPAPAVAEYLDLRFALPELTRGLSDVLHERTQGVPLLVRSVADDWVSRGLVAREGHRWRAAALQEALAERIAGSVTQLLEGQLASLDDATRRMLEAAAVAGRAFTAPIVGRICGQPDDAVEEELGALAHAGVFLYEDIATGSFEFLHDMHREVVYARIPPARRARYHLAAGCWLESEGGARNAAELSVHFREGRDAVRAVRYLRLAAEQAIARRAPTEAFDLVSAALELLKKQQPPPLEVAADAMRLETMAARLRILLNGWASPEARTAFERALGYAGTTNDPAAAGAVELGLATLLEVSGEYEASQAVLERHLTVHPDSAYLVEAHEVLACSLYHQGRFTESIDHARRALTNIDPAAGYHTFACFGDSPIVSSHGWKALSQWFLGYPDTALLSMRESLAAARSHYYSLPGAYTQLAHIHQLRRELTPCVHAAEQAIRHAKEQGFPVRGSIAAIFEGWALTLLGDEGGLKRLLQGLAGARAAGFRIDEPLYLALLAEAYAAAGKQEEAALAVEEALRAKPGDRAFFYHAELQRLRARYSGDTKWLHRALDTARRQKARAIELRITLDLGDTQAMASLYRTFQEGLDTPDLRQASAMIGQRRSV